MPIEEISDYERFDFRALWTKRNRMAAVESAVLGNLLQSCDRRRVLEMGTGFGRLSPLVARASNEFIGVDLAPAMLSEARSRVLANDVSPARITMVLANLYHLPFADGSVSTALMIRLYHHFEDPIPILSELARVLCDGGSFVISYSPHPSVGTVVHDLRTVLRSGRFGQEGPLTLDARVVVGLPPSPFPTYVVSHQALRASLASVGLLVDCEWGSGLEEWFPLLPKAAYLSLGKEFPEVLGFPTVFASGHKPGPSLSTLAPAADIFQCPRCRYRLRIPAGPDWSSRCLSCGLPLGSAGGVGDFRYVGADAVVYAGGLRDPTIAAPPVR